jgi:poly-gamma-glutamate capsule biosynthesis protein CapA/YwtB (metallophosphatase superfamily)
MTERSHVVWRAENSGPAVARVAVAGDFLPAGRLQLPQSDAWAGAASALAPNFDDVATTLLNLECVIDAAGLSARKLVGLGQIVCAPSQSLDYLGAIRAVAVGFANNHSYDFGAAGVERTRQALSRRNLTLLGAGRDTASPPDVFVWRGPNSICVGLWAAAKASHDLARGGAAGVEPATLRRAKQALELMRCRGARFSIALLHAGVLRTNRPDPADVKLMDSMAEAGFDLVAASHSHRISGSKLVRAKRNRPAFCFYGLGSVVSGYIAAPIEREGLIVVVGFNSDGDLASLEVRPVSLAASGFGEAPSAEVSGIILNRFCSLSAEIGDGSSKQRFYQETSQNLVRLYLRDARAAIRESGVVGLARKTARIRMRHLRRLAHGFLP